MCACYVVWCIWGKKSLLTESNRRPSVYKTDVIPLNQGGLRDAMLGIRASVPLCVSG